ncbi:acyltransferase [Verrucomicrobiota bacterium sgz303538]
MILNKLLRRILRTRGSAEVEPLHQTLNRQWGCFIAPEAKLDIDSPEKLRLGENASIGSFSVIVVRDDPAASSPVSSLEVGAGTYIGELNNIRAAGGAIRIGIKCLVSQHVSIIAANHVIGPREEYILDQPWDHVKTGVTIEDDCWIGCGAIILPGVNVGRGCVVGAGSVVTKSVPPYSVIAGSPAKVIRTR